MSDNWVVRNLENALETWNDKLTEIWGLLTDTPEEFKGGKIWNVILDINRHSFACFVLCCRRYENLRLICRS